MLYRIMQQKIFCEHPYISLFLFTKLKQYGVVQCLEHMPDPRDLALPLPCCIPACLDKSQPFCKMGLINYLIYKHVVTLKKVMFVKYIEILRWKTVYKFNTISVVKSLFINNRPCSLKPCFGWHHWNLAVWYGRHTIGLPCSPSFPPSQYSCSIGGWEG